MHLEVTTAGEQAILFSNKANSWFGVTDVVVTGKGEPAPKEEMAEYVQPVFSKEEPANAKRLAKLASRWDFSKRAWPCHKKSPGEMPGLGKSEWSIS